MMLNLLFLSLRVRFTISANRLINFLKHVPLIKRAVPAKIYGDYSLKAIFAVFGAFLIAVKKVMFRFMYAGLITALGMFTHLISVNGGFSALFTDTSFKMGNTAGVVYHILTVWFILSVVGGILRAVTVEAFDHESDNIMLNHLRANPAVYAKSRIVFKIAADSLLYIPYLLLAFALGGIPLWCVFVMLLMYISFRLCGEAVNLLMFRYIGRHFGRLPFSLAGIPLVFAAVYIPMYYGTPDWLAVLSSPLAAIACAAAGGLALLYIKGYPRYAKILRERIARSEEILTKSRQKLSVKKAQSGGTAGLNLADAKNWSRGIKNEDIQSGRHDNKTGFAYLNAIFFDRHSKFFKKKIFQRIVVILAPFIAVAAFTLIFLFFEGGLPMEVLKIDDALFSMSIKSLFNFSPVFFFIIYIASMGRTVTASVFSNCDIHMLHYPYYRTRETIFASFKARLTAIIKYNFIITTVISFSAIASLWFLYGYMNLLYAGIFFILMLTMGVFFAFNDLFLYYCIQPYDSAGQSKSNVYKVINTVIYIIAYINFQSRFEFIPYTVTVLTATVLYLGIGTRLLLSLSPKKFRLR